MADNMLEQVLDHIHNYFYTGDVISGTFTVTSGALTVTGLQNGQYYHITGSVFNDGIHQYPSDDLTDETFTGAIHPMAVPKTMLSLADEIADWVDEYGDVMNSPYQSETVIGVYSYTKGSGGSGSGSGRDNSAVSWQTQFYNRLNQYRKVSGR